MNATLVPVAVTVAQICPSCGVRLPLPRRVLAARLRCPSLACNAHLCIRGGRVSAA